MRFDIVMSFLLAPRCHRVANLHDCAAMLRCWDSFWHHEALYARAQIPLCGQFAILLRHVALLRFILELLSAHFGCMLCFRNPFWSCYLTILGAFWHHVVLYAGAQMPSRGHCASFWCHVALLMSFWSCYLAILGAFWHHVVLYARVQMPHPWPLRAILPPCYVVGIHLAASCGYLGRILASYWALLSHPHPLCSHCAWFCYHVALLGFILTSWCALCSRPDPIVWPTRRTFTPCYAVEIFFGAVICHFGCILVLCCALGIHFGTIIWPFGEHFDIMLCFMLASRCHPVASVRDFPAMLGCWDLFWSCYLTILGAFWHHVVLYARAARSFLFK